MKGVLRGAHAEACGSAMATSATSTSTRAMLPSSRRTAFSGANVTMSALQQGSKRVAGSRQPRLVCLAQAAATELSAAELRGERGSMRRRSCNRCLRVITGAILDLQRP